MTEAERPALVLQLGLGARGRKWAEISRSSPHVVPVGYVEPSAEARSWTSAQGFAEPVFPDLPAALRTVSADLALVVTPPEGRAALVTTLLDHGMHVLAEKPLALTLPDALAMVRAAERTGRSLGVVQNFRYMPVNLTLRDMVQSGRYGAPTYATVLYIRNRDGHAPHLNKYPLVMDHPMLLEQSIHHLDLLRFVYGAEVEEVTCTTWNPPGSRYRGDACAAALVRMRGGPMVVYHGTWVSGSDQLEFRWRTDCERGVIIQRDLFGDLVEGAAADTELRPVTLAPAEPFMTDSARLLDDFIDACRRNRPFASSGRDHLQTLALTLACIESGQSGRPVSLSEFSQRWGVDSQG